MAIAAASLVEVWSESILERVRQNLNLRSLVRDHSAELGGRHQLHLTDLKRPVTLVDRSGSDQHYEVFGTAQQPDSQNFTLDMTDYFSWNLAIPWVDELETAGNIMAQTNIWSTYQIEQRLQSDIRSALQGGAEAHTFDIPIVHTGGTGTKINDEAGVELLLDALLDAQVQADTDGWPMDRRYFITSPYIHGLMARYLRNKGNDFVTTGFAAGALTAGAPPTIHGWQIHKDPGITGSVAAAATAKQFRSFCILGGETIRYAQQIQRVRVIEDPTRPQQLLQGLVRYGLLIPNPGASNTNEFFYEVHYTVS